MATAASLTVSVEGNPQMDRSDPYKVICDWLSTDLGVVSIGIAATLAAANLAIGYAMPQPSKLQGYIKGIETAPGEEGDLATDLPTALYDVTLLDAHSYDVAGASLANRSGTVAEEVIPSSPIPLDSELTLTIAAAGDAKQGRLILFIDPGV